LVLAATLAVAPLAAGQADEVPDTLVTPAENLETGLDRVSEADTVDQAREAHDTDVQPSGQTLRAYAEDLAGDDGRLLVTYLDRLDQALENGNLSDARSLAGAAANHLADAIAPAAQAWDANRTAVLPGPVEVDEDKLTARLVLVNPPVTGVGAWEASLVLPGSEPVEATVTHGQGETEWDPTNGTVRWASFDAQAASGLSSTEDRGLLLGEATYELGTLEPGDTVRVETQADEVDDADGEPVPAVGVDAERRIQAVDDGLGVAWLTIAGVLVAGVGLLVWTQRWEV
jgi:hypothetical protein